MALSAFVIAAFFAVPVYLTGEPAEHMVESLPGVSEPIMEQHEDAGLIAFVAMSILGVVSLGGLAIFRQPRLIPAWHGFFVVIAAVVVSGLMAWTANLGGQIRHSEIRSDTTAPARAQHDDD